MTQTAYLPEVTPQIDNDVRRPVRVVLSRIPVPSRRAPLPSCNAAPYSWAMLEYVREGLAIQEQLRFEAVEPLDADELRALLAATHNRRCRNMVTGRRGSEEEILVDRLLATVGAAVS